MTSYISEYFSKKKQNNKITQSLPEEQQNFWLEFLTDSDRKEGNADRNSRRKTVSLDFQLKNERTGDETTLLDLLIDDTPTPLESIVQTEYDEFISSQLSHLEVILDELDELDKEIILLYFNYKEQDCKHKGYEFKKYKQRSYREMGRILNLDYRKIQRKIPRIMNYIKERLLEEINKNS